MHACTPTQSDTIIPYVDYGHVYVHFRCATPSSFETRAQARARVHSKFYNISPEATHIFRGACGFRFFCGVVFFVIAIIGQ